MNRLYAFLLASALLLSCAATACAEAQPLTDEASAWWNGPWYGWCVVSAAGGSYAENQGQRWDVVGNIQTMDEHGVIVLWDYDAYAECCFITALGDFQYDESGLGRFYAEGGFAFDASLEEKMLSARPVWELAHTLCVKGVYTDPEDARSWYRYEIYLRPWGMEWEDVKAAEADELPYPDMLPQHYEDWYLDQLARGLDPLTEPDADALEP